MSVTLNVRQLLLLTDGCSNRGPSPAIVAQKVKKFGITVNVIGVTNDNESLHGAAVVEIENIATAGGGLSRIVTTSDLSNTVQTLTQQSMSLGIQHSVESILQKRLGGSGSLTELSPHVRSSFVRWMEDVEAEGVVHVLVLVDTSASMRSKLPAVKKALEDVHIHLRSRRAISWLSLYTFPAKNYTHPISCALPWTTDADKLRYWLNSVHIGGVTPTGPALGAAANEFPLESGLGGHVV